MTSLMCAMLLLSALIACTLVALFWLNFLWRFLTMSNAAERERRRNAEHRRRQRELVSALRDREPRP